MKIKVAMLDRDIHYLNRIVAVLGTKFADKLEISSFTKPEVAFDEIESRHIDVLIAADCFDIECEKLPKQCGFAYFVENHDIETVKGEQAICKYQKPDMIYKQILSIFAECADDITEINTGEAEQCKVISFLSAAGGTGSSTAAAACAVRFAQKGHRVLYLNLEQFGSADVFFQGDGVGNFGDIIYAIKSKKGNLSFKLESTVKQDISGVYFYSATPMALDMAELTSEEVRNMISNIRIYGEYEYIILDMDFSLEKSQIDVLCECSTIVIVADGSPTSNVKLERVITSMRILEEQNDWNLIMKSGILYNRFSSKTSERLVVDGIKEYGGIKRYEGYSVEQLLREMADIAAFDDLA